MRACVSPASCHTAAYVHWSRHTGTVDENEWCYTVHTKGSKLRIIFDVVNTEDLSMRDVLQSDREQKVIRFLGKTRASETRAILDPAAGSLVQMDNGRRLSDAIDPSINCPLFQESCPGGRRRIMWMGEIRIMQILKSSIEDPRATQTAILTIMR